MEVCETEITTYRLVGQSVIVIEVPRRSLCVYDMASVCFQLSSWPPYCLFFQPLSVLGWIEVIGLYFQCPQAVCCHWGEIEPFPAKQAKDGLAECDQPGKHPLKFSAKAEGIDSEPWRGQTVRWIHSPTELYCDRFCLCSGCLLHPVILDDPLPCFGMQLGWGIHLNKSMIGDESKS